MEVGLPLVLFLIVRNQTKRYTILNVKWGRNSVIIIIFIFPLLRPQFVDMKPIISSKFSDTIELDKEGFYPCILLQCTCIYKLCYLDPPTLVLNVIHVLGSLWYPDNGAFLAPSPVALCKCILLAECERSLLALWRLHSFQQRVNPWLTSVSSVTLSFFFVTASLTCMYQFVSLINHILTIETTLTTLSSLWFCSV